MPMGTRRYVAIMQWLTYLSGYYNVLLLAGKKWFVLEIFRIY